MGQRTQTIITIAGGSDIHSYAYHNQRGYGRPTVTSILAVADYYIQHVHRDYIRTREFQAIMARPVGLDEYFDFDKPYKCTNEDNIFEGHDNNDGYGVVTIDKGTEQIHIYARCHEGLEYLTADALVQYIFDCGCEHYITPTRLMWAQGVIDRIKEHNKEKEYITLQIPEDFDIFDAFYKRKYPIERLLPQIKEWEKEIDECCQRLDTEATKESVSEILENIGHEMCAINL